MKISGNEIISGVFQAFGDCELSVGDDRAISEISFLGNYFRAISYKIKNIPNPHITLPESRIWIMQR